MKVVGEQEAYENLANAIILQAVKDYRMALAGLKRHPSNYKMQYLKKDVESFFLSNWFVELTDLDGQALLEQLRKEAESGEE